MPIYEFVCTSCDHEFEELVRGSDGKAVACPKCGQPKTSRKLSVFAARATGPQPSAPIAQACGRCGDSNGPCGMS